MRQLIFTLLMIMTMASCSTLTKTQCQKGDWKIYGIVDAYQGRQEAFIEEHLDACGSDVVADQKRSEYLQGWKEAKAAFCTKEVAFHLGANRIKQSEACPVDVAKIVEDSYKEGMKLWSMKEELGEIDTNIVEVEKQEAERQKNAGTFERIVIGLQGGETERNKFALKLRERKINLQTEVNLLEMSHPVPPLFKEKFSNEVHLNYAGSMLGTTMGFGIGHAFQERYRKKGWWFTAIETGVLFIPGAGAMFGFLGAKIWESIDLWQYSYRASLGYPEVKD